MGFGRGKTASSRNRGYDKPAAGDGTAVLTALVPVAAESKFLSLSGCGNVMTQKK